MDESAVKTSSDPAPHAELTFDVKQYSELQKTMGKEEYMKFVMNKFLESKHKAKMKVPQPAVQVFRH